MYSFDVILSPMSSPAFSKEHWSDESVEICRVVERALRDADAIDTESLCILAGSKVWSVSVAMIVLDHAGNLIDACAAAALASLLHFRRPAVTVEASGKVVEHSWDDQDPAPLALHHTPVSVSFSFLESIALVDPSDDEEVVVSGALHVAINGHGEICSLQKSGGCPIDADMMLRCIMIAGIRANEIIDLIQTSVQNSLRERGTNVRMSLISYLEAPKN